MGRRGWLIIAAFAATAIVAAAAGLHGSTATAEGWHETAWPFPRDGWPAGRAFRCNSPGCGGEAKLFVRPKIGFCNCDGGVADDDEVDRVADLDLLADRFTPRAPGDRLQLGGMAGRIRAYDLQTADPARRIALGIALSRRCDLMVAAIQGHGGDDALSRSALAFLASDTMTSWMSDALNGPSH